MVDTPWFLLEMPQADPACFHLIDCNSVLGCEPANIISLTLYSIKDKFRNGCYFENVNRTLVDIISIPLEMKGSLPSLY